VAIRDVWGYMFSNDEQVVALTSSVLLIYSIFAVFDGGQAMGAGIIRGVGRQMIGAIFNFLGFYVLGLPLGYYLCFQAGMGLYGLWWGLSGALFVCFTGYYVIILRLNWTKESLRAQERVQKSQNDPMPATEEISLKPLSNGNGLNDLNGASDHAATELTADYDEEDEFDSSFLITHPTSNSRLLS